MKLVNFSDLIITEYYKSTQQYPLTNHRLMALYFIFVADMVHTLQGSSELQLEQNENFSFVATNLGPIIKSVEHSYPLSQITKKHIVDQKSLDKLEKIYGRLWEDFTDFDVIREIVLEVLGNTRFLSTQELIDCINKEFVHYSGGEYDLDFQDLEKLFVSQETWNILSNIFNLNDYGFTRSEVLNEQENQYIEDDSEEDEEDELNNFFGFAEQALDKKFGKTEDSMER